MIDLLVCEGSSALRSAVLTAIFSFIPLSRDPGPSAFLLSVCFLQRKRVSLCSGGSGVPPQTRFRTKAANLWLRAVLQEELCDGPSAANALSQRLAASSKVTPMPSLGAAPCRGRKCRAARSGRLCRAVSVGPSPLRSSSWNQLNPVSL